MIKNKLILMNELSLSTLLDLHSLQNLMDKLYLATNIPFALIDLDGKILVGSGWQPICIDFHRANKETEKMCIRSDLAIGDRLKSGEKYVFFECPMGLTDCATPLIINDQYLANIFTGQFFLNPPNRDRFLINAKEFGFNVDSYMNALDQVPIFQESEVRHILDFYVEYTKNLAEMGQKNLELQNMNKMLKELEDERVRNQNLASLTFLAAGIAHDYNNLLTSILGNINIIQLLGKDLPQNITDSLKTCEKAVYQARDLTQKLSTFAKGGDPIKKPLNVKDIISESLDLMTKGSNCTYELTLEIDLPLIEGDKSQISQVFNNLIINAIQAMPIGGIVRVSGEILKENLEFSINLKAFNYLKITIQDNGVGIPKSIQKNIFQPYFTTKATGTGLGLATTFSIIKRHGGYINFISEENKGTTFNIYLPVNRSLKIRDDSTHKVELNKKAKILIMDDDVLIQNMFVKFLELLGFESVVIDDGNLILERLSEASKQSKPFDAIIMDIVIPGGMGGIETIELVRKNDPNIKVIVCSGYSEHSVLANYKTYGFNERLAKPFDFNDLKKVLANVLNNP
jgi:signal transduction histidine kinase/CheY-like chemotaxis protein